jgi:hypothetical protein
LGGSARGFFYTVPLKFEKNMYSSENVRVIEALYSSGSGHIGPSPFFSLSAWLTMADSPHACG